MAALEIKSIHLGYCRKKVTSFSKTGAVSFLTVLG